MHSSNDIIYMNKALQLASKGQYTARPNPLVGCIIVQDGKIVGEGCHWQAGQAHAEILALNEAKEKARGATCYVTLEPCPHWGRTGPCINPLRESGIKRVVIAVLDPNPLVSGKGKAALEEAGIAVEVGLCSEQAIALNKGFFSRMQRGRPYVRAKVAMSLDGRIALANGKSQWITSEQSRMDGHFARARSGAILTGSQTVQKDNCRLTFRGDLPEDLPPEVTFEQPWRLLIDSQMRCAKSAAIFSAPGKTFVMVTEKTIVQQEETRDIVQLNEKEGYVDLEALLNWCGQNEINDLLVESGGVLTGALVKAGLIDELIVYVAPKLLGHEAKPMAFLVESALDESVGRFEKIERMGIDLKITLSLSEFARAFYEHS